MSSNKYYTIKVGNTEGELIEVGELDRESGLPKGPPQKAIAPPGGTAIPNYSRVWGKPEKTKEGKYTGEWEPMEWSAQGGEVLEIRYLKACKSLLVAYQKQVGLAPGLEDMEIDLPHGITDFDERAEPLLVQMLKLHSCNGASPCRDPDNQVVIYTDFDEKVMVKKRIAKGETLYEAMGHVMTIKNDTNALRVLAAICGLDPKKQNNVLVDELLMFVEQAPDKFLANRHKYRDYVRQIMLRAIDFGLVDLSTSGKVMLLTENGGAVLSAIPSTVKGDKKIDYMAEHAFDTAVYDAIDKIREAINEKELALGKV